MKEEVDKISGKYVPVTKSGQITVYLPLEKCADLDELKASGYEVPVGSRDLVHIAVLIREAESRRSESDQRKLQFVNEDLADFSQEVGTIDLVCPYCLGWINDKCPAHKGKVICHWYALDRLLEQGIELDGCPVLGFLIEQDFVGLLGFARDLGYQESKEGYVSKCHLCVDIRKYLVTKQEFKELKPKEFYSKLE